MNKRSRIRNKERNRYAKLKNSVTKLNTGNDPLGIPNVNFTVISAYDDYGCKDNIVKQAKRVEKLALYKKQRLERGFDDTELWDLSYTIASFILPRLVEFSKVTNGYPVDGKINSMEEWYAVLDKMIAAFDYIVNEEKYDDELSAELKIEWGGLYEEKKLPDGNYEIVKTEKYNEALMKYYHERQKKRYDSIKEGLSLFGEYFETLWR